MKAIKPKWTALLASELLADGKIWDESAETAKEIAGRIGVCKTSADSKIRDAVADGRLEKVWRRINGIPVAAYRVKK
jgi:hypothetical protein